MDRKQFQATVVKVDFGMTALLLALTATRFRKDRTVWTALPMVRGAILLAEIGHRLRDQGNQE